MKMISQKEMEKIREKLDYIELLLLERTLNDVEYHKSEIKRLRETIKEYEKIPLEKRTQEEKYTLLDLREQLREDQKALRRCYYWLKKNGYR